MNRGTRLAAIIVFAAVVLLLPLPRPQQRLLATSCTTDGQCSAPDGACDKTTSTCVQCVANGHSALSQSDCCSDYLDPSTNLCATNKSCSGCGNDGNCSQCASGNACDQSDAQCVSCVQDGHSAEVASDCCGGFLNNSGVCETCDACSDDSRCSDCEEYCDLSNEHCTSCVPDGDVAEQPFDCCSGFADYSNGYYCEEP